MTIINGDARSLASLGDVKGPTGATINAVARFDGATGKFIKNSSVIIDDSGNITLPSLSTFDGRDVSVDGASLDSHIASTTNPHSVTKTQVGLSAVSNDAQLKIASNLSDLNNVVTARANLGLSTVAASGSHLDLSNIGTNTHVQIDSHIASTSNPHAVTKTQVGLSAVSNDAQLKIASNLSDLNNAATARSNLGLVIGTDVQAYDVELAAIAGLTSAADRLPYFTGSGTASLATLTTFGRSLIDDVDASTARTTLGLGTLATQSGTFSGTSSGTNTGDQTITLTGDVTGSGTGSFAATIANDAVTYAKIQNVSATDKLLGRSTSGAGDVEEITCTSFARSILDDADASTARTTLGLGTFATLSSLEHSSLTSLSADDHSQYALLAGRATGQTLSGGVAASENLTLNSTSHATKGKIFFGASSAYDGTNIRFGVGSTSPSTTIHALSTTEQLRLGYDSTNYARHTISSIGSWTVDLVSAAGTPLITFNHATTIYNGIKVHANTGFNAEFNRASDNTGGPNFLVRKSRGTLTSPALVLAGDTIGNFLFQGYNDDWRTCANISAIVESGVGATGADMPGSLVFWTTPDGSATQTEKMRITSAGYVGIGATVPVSILEACETTGGVFTLSRNDTSITANDMIGKIQFYAPDTSSTTNKIVANIEAQATHTVTTDINPGRLIFRTTSTTVAATPTERMRIDETGNVGIGVSPTYKLDVLGTTTRFGSTLADDRADATLKVNYMVTPQYTNANTSFMAFGSSSGSSTNEVFYGGGSSSYNCATLLSFYTAANQTTVSGTERMRVNSSGDVGIGTSTVSARLHTISTTEQLRVGYDASNYYSTTVGSTGAVTFDAVGSGARFIFSDRLNIPTATPASASATGTAGDIAWDASFVYVCVGTNSWKRVAIAAW